MSKKRYYLAYGSNLNPAQMHSRCPGAKPIGYTMLSGYELVFKSSRTGYYLTIEPKKGGRVPVGVWEVSAEHERSLDRYEGYPVCYYKKELRLPVTRFARTRDRMLSEGEGVSALDLKPTASGRTVKTNAFIYILHENRRVGLPTTQYLFRCLRGYRAFGFAPEYLYDAFERSGEHSLFGKE